MDSDIGLNFDVVYECITEACGKLEVFELLDVAVETYYTFRSKGDEVFREECFNFSAFLYELSEQLIWSKTETGKLIYAGSAKDILISATQDMLRRLHEDSECSLS